MPSSRWRRAAVRALAHGDSGPAGTGSVNQPPREPHGTDAQSYRQRDEHWRCESRAWGGVDMTRTTNARIAGFTYLFYARLPQRDRPGPALQARGPLGARAVEPAGGRTFW